MTISVDSPYFDNVTELWVTIVGYEVFTIFSNPQPPVVKITKTLGKVVINYDQKTVAFPLSREEIQRLCNLDCYAQVHYKTQSGISYVTEVTPIPRWYFSRLLSEMDKKEE